ncbi:hypothetical protein FOXG_22852 [Fusarium oxysporum f. sp. lycopersici 4287]|uniref:Uncharacterized protein n=1 Tax=Fusarium oxysporum f. sp. lycopersici (strain 4287 / CBS 123668 / FGSC 9935 / NRRL 34936) TaxID=426428 RepID=A0A0J9WAW6_FUSO4|nr:hypothetical protein FOXG_22852 [Fusarium oxysporum f. sp. lycopersici 4287]KNB20529.1 hypothetical protein FOXG_22852 [Fusarium oxysporum f. sp. lycopersici 4287]
MYFSFQCFVFLLQLPCCVFHMLSSLVHFFHRALKLSAMQRQAGRISFYNRIKKLDFFSWQLGHLEHIGSQRPPSVEVVHERFVTLLLDLCPNILPVLNIAGRAQITKIRRRFGTFGKILVILKAELRYSFLNSSIQLEPLLPTRHAILLPSLGVFDKDPCSFSTPAVFVQYVC